MESTEVIRPFSYRSLQSGGRKDMKDSLNGNSIKLTINYESRKIQQKCNCCMTVYKFREVIQRGGIQCNMNKSKETVKHKTSGKRMVIYLISGQEKYKGNVENQNIDAGLNSS